MYRSRYVINKRGERTEEMLRKEGMDSVEEEGMEMMQRPGSSTAISDLSEETSVKKG